MASRRKTKNEITEQAHDDAVRLLTMEYYASVRGLVADMKQALKDKEIRDRDGFEQRLDESVEASYWVIYTHANKQVMLVSGNDDAYFEMGFGEPPGDSDSIDWAKLAFFAMRADVQQRCEAEGIEPPEED